MDDRRTHRVYAHANSMHEFVMAHGSETLLRCLGQIDGDAFLSLPSCQAASTQQQPQHLQQHAVGSEPASDSSNEACQDSAGRAWRDEMPGVQKMPQPLSHMVPQQGFLQRLVSVGWWRWCR